MNAKDIDFPKLLRVMRKGHRINQMQLAELMRNMGHDVHQTTISRFENGTQEPTLSQAIDLDSILRLGLFALNDGYGHGYRAGIDAARKALGAL